MSNSLKRTDDEIEEVIVVCYESETGGGSKFPGMTYEQGVKAGIEWLVGDTDESPMED